MKKHLFTICLLMMIAPYVFSQHTLLVRNKQTGKKFTFSQNSYMTFEMYNLQKQYVSWKVERIKDTSLVLSTYSFCQDTTRTYSFSEREIQEIPFSQISYYKIEDNNGKKIAAGWGMLIGGFFMVCSPFAAYDSDTKAWTPEAAITVAAAGSTLFTTSYFFFKKISKKEQYFDGKEWEMQKLSKKQ